jgi:hypothetical protein
VVGVIGNDNTCELGHDGAWSRGVLRMLISIVSPFLEAIK